MRLLLTDAARVSTVAHCCLLRIERRAEQSFLRVVLAGAEHQDKEGVSREKKIAM